MPDLCKNNWVESNLKGETFLNISSDCCTLDLNRRHCVPPSGLHGGERVRGSKSGDNHIPLQVHQRRLSKELRLQRRSTRQPARGGHPVRPQKSQRVWEEHHQPPTLQVSSATFCGYRLVHLIVKASTLTLCLPLQEDLPVCGRCFPWRRTLCFTCSDAQ